VLDELKTYLNILRRLSAKYRFSNNKTRSFQRLKSELEACESRLHCAIQRPQIALGYSCLEFCKLTLGKDLTDFYCWQYFRNTNGMEQKTATWLFWTVLTTRFSSRGSQNRHVTLPIFTWLEMEATDFVYPMHTERYFECLTAIYRHILIICYLNVRVGQNQRIKTLQKHT
jgi:hypothetical protein